MNQKATYELTITEKLEQLTAPDMVDAIWARIEAQLDIDLPTDDGPTNPPAAPTSGPRKWMNRGFIIAAIAVVLIYLFNNRKQTITSNDQPNITAPITTPNNNDNPVRNNSPGTNSTQTPTNNTSAPTTSSNGLPVDSNSIAPVTGPQPLQPDTAAVKTNAAPVFTPPVVTPQKNTPPDSTKKGRGVKGITDSDYKIVPKKDSSKS
jgi:cytoskeletal protein RodZ